MSSTDDFQDVVRVVTEARVARAIGAASVIVRSAASASIAAHAIGHMRCRLAGGPMAARVRLAGILLLTAIVTHAVLLLLIPEFVRPAVLELFRAQVVVASLILIGAAPWIAHAWPGSRLRRLIGIKRHFVGAIGSHSQGRFPVAIATNTIPRDTLLDRGATLSPAAYWELLVNLTRREVKGRYSQSFFGFAWAMAQPLATMLVFTFVFSKLGNIGADGAPYPLFAYAALVPWFFFSNSVSSGMMSVITYRNIVTKTYFPREIIPLAQVSSRFLDFGAAALLFVLMALYYRVGFGVWALTAPLLFLMLVAFTCAVTLLTSATNVFYRDVSPVVTIALQLWLYLTPVAYPLAKVPERYRLFFALNPLTAIIEGTRAALVFNRAPDWSLVGMGAGITAVLLVFSFALFKKLDRYFADVI